MARRRRKLAHNRSDGVGFKVLAKLRRQWSPMQVSTWLKLRYPHLPEHWVSHTTIYRAIKLLPRGELKRELLGSLRQQGKARASGLEQPIGKLWVHQLIHDSPWQRAGCENTNGLIRQYLPKGMDLTDITQSELDAIAERLNTRPRKVLQFRTSEEVWNAMLAGKSFKQAINIPVTDFSPFPSHR